MVKTFDEWFLSLPGNPCYSYYDFLKEAWKAAQEVEREACANMCLSLFDPDDDTCNEAELCADAIRARGNNGK